jgi:phytoene dehydrogenase-like protein
MTTVHIIGASLSGLIAGAKLARAGIAVQVYEAQSQPGGKYRLRDAAEGNHRLTGHTDLLLLRDAKTMRELRALGCAHTLCPFDSDASFMDLKSGNPSPLTSLSFPLLSLAENLQFWGTLWLYPKRSVAQAFGYYHPLRSRFLEPFCTHILQRPITEVTLRDLRAYLGTFRRSKRYHALSYFRESAYHSLISPAVAQIEHEGGTFYFQHALTRMEWGEHRITQLHFARSKRVVHSNDIVLFALSPHRLETFVPHMRGSQQHPPARSVEVAYALQTGGQSRLIPTVSGQCDWIRIAPETVTSIQTIANENADNEQVKRTHWHDVSKVLGMENHSRPPATVTRTPRAEYHAMGLQPLANQPRLILAHRAAAPKQPLTINRQIHAGIRAADAVRRLV